MIKLAIKNTNLLTCKRWSSTLKPSYDLIKAEIRGKVGLITLNRPKALNALNNALMDDISHAANAFDSDDNIGAIVITGSEKAFAAGADIKEMSQKTYVDMYTNNAFENWSNIPKIRKPTSNTF